MQTFRIILGLVLSVGGLMWWPNRSRLNPFFALLFACLLFASVAGVPINNIVPIMQTGMGSLLGQIAIVIALGAVLGTLLERTGAMTVMSKGLLDIMGKRRPVISMSIIGAMVGIPVFCDSGFIILSKLVPQIAAGTSAAESSLTMALASGLYTTHTMVPPTPGPLAAASTLGLGEDMGLVILIGCLAAIPVVLTSYLFATTWGKSSSMIPTNVTSPPELRGSWFSAFLPLVLPIFLIAATSFSRMLHEENPVRTLLNILGTPAIALLIGVLLSFRLLKKEHQADWPGWVTESLKDAGIIILITGAGGAFGSLIKESGLGTLITDLAGGSKLQSIGFLFLAWLIAALLKTSQGSSTSSMIITSALLSPLASAAGMTTPVELAILVVAIGGGSMTVSHGNDSYFWVVSQFGRISAADNFRLFTPMTLVQGITALITSIALLLVIGLF